MLGETEPKIAPVAGAELAYHEQVEGGADDQLLEHVDDLAAFLRAIDAAPAHLSSAIPRVPSSACSQRSATRPSSAAASSRSPPVVSLYGQHAATTSRRGRGQAIMRAENLAERAYLERRRRRFNAPTHHP